LIDKAANKTVKQLLMPSRSNSLRTVNYLDFGYPNHVGTKAAKQICRTVSKRLKMFQTAKQEDILRIEEFGEIIA